MFRNFFRVEGSEGERDYAFDHDLSKGLCFINKLITGHSRKATPTETTPQKEFSSSLPFFCTGLQFFGLHPEKLAKVNER